MSKTKNQSPLDRVLTLMDRMQISQRELARRAGISPGTLPMAKQSGKISLETLQAVAPVLGVAVGELLGEAPGAIKPDATYRRIPLDRLAFSEWNERDGCEEFAAIENLIEDIADRGLLQNLVVYPHATRDGQFCVIAGQRRLMALQYLNRQDRLPENLHDGIPCRVFPDDLQALEVTIVENLKREDVHFLERAQAFARLRDRRGYKAPQIAKLIGYDERMVQQYLQIHDKLPEDHKAAARRGELTFKAARELVQEKQVKQAETPPPPEQPPILAACGHVEPDRPADKTEPGSGYAHPPKKVVAPKPAKAAKKQPPAQRRDPDISELEREIEAGLGLKCDIWKNGDETWDFTLDSLSLDQMDHVLGLLLPNRRK